MIGQVISHYRIVEKLGEGGMGVVYRAEDTKLGRPVALKFLSVQLLSEEEEIERFKAEARAASSINHPNICTIHDIDEVYGRWFIVMEYLEGETFAGLLRRKTLSLHETLGYAIQACEAFAAAHRRNIVHGDIKPSNLFLTTDGRVKLLDFGLSKAWVLHVPEDDRTVKLERKDTVSGTLRYMSPEQARGWETDCRSDIFSFGVVLYEMLTGRRPFDGDTTTAILSAVIADEPVPVTVLRPELSEDLRRIVHKCLRKEPELRYQDTGELLAELKVQRRRLDFGQAIERTQHLPPAPPRGLEPVEQEFGEEVREEIPEAAAVVEVESGEVLADPVYDVDSAAHAEAAAHEIVSVHPQKKRRSHVSRLKVLAGLIVLAILIVAAWGSGFFGIERLWQRRSAPDTVGQSPPTPLQSPRTAEQSPPSEEKPPPTEEKSPPTEEKPPLEKLTVDAGFPTIALKGGDTMVLEMGQGAYQEPGYDAKDETDGDLTARVAVEGAVDPTKPGEYRLAYVVKNSAGHETRTTRTVKVQDTRPPYIGEVLPANGAESVLLNSRIALRIKDDGTGVDKSSIRMTLNGSSVETERLSIAGTEKDCSVTYDPPEDFPEYKTATVNVEAADLQGNRMKPQQYSFRTEDKTPPRVSRHEPGRDDKNVSVGTNITVYLEDDGAGVNGESIAVSVKAGEQQVSGERTATTQPGITVWVPSAPFAYKQDVTVVVEAKDALGNPMKPYTFTFTTATGEVPKITLQPRSARVKAGAAVTFSAEATSPTDMQYQWKKDGKEIEGATSSRYTIPSAGQSDVGSYVCVVTNLSGQATSNPATLTIDEPPKITLTSDKPVTWEMGTAFPDGELAYKAADKEDGDITTKVEVENRVDRTKPGKYAVDYHLKDSAGNETQATKAVEVVDTKPPYAADLSPAGGVEVRSGDKISFQVKDNGVGVDKDSITITVDGAPA
ncbi:MAG: DUF5011 domain-containing protein, partial [bacterium]|nr:DUF5011 domain-containing protein [bacterium]